MPKGKALSGREMKELRERRARAQRRNGRSLASSKRKLNDQQKKANIRAKYGASGKPGLVTVKRLDGMTGEWVEQAPIDQSKFQKRA